MLVKRFRQLGFLKWLYHIFYYFFDDVSTGRAWGVLVLAIGNLLPDWQFCAFIRPVFWKIGGAKMQGFGSHAIRKGVFVEYLNNLEIGTNLHINRDTYIGSNGFVRIGSFVTIAPRCKLLTMSHSGQMHELPVIADIELKDNCIVYAGATILPGTTIERFVVIAAGAVVGGKTVPGGVYAGVPAVFKGYRRDLDMAGITGKL